MRSIAIALSLTFVAGSVTAQGAPSAGSEHAIIVKPDQVSYGPAPATLPAGAELAVLEGKPSEPGPFTMRLRLPDGYRIPPHYHPAIEHVTVLEGTFKVGMGDKFDASALKALPTGTFGALAPGTRHFAQAQGRTVVQVHGVGPWKLTYVNPADDPRNKTP
jgi:quercetin dioxygenase-like cupin family protein